MHKRPNATDSGFNLNNLPLCESYHRLLTMEVAVHLEEPHDSVGVSHRDHAHWSEGGVKTRDVHCAHHRERPQIDQTDRASGVDGTAWDRAEGASQDASERSNTFHGGAPSSHASSIM